MSSEKVQNDGICSVNQFPTGDSLHLNEKILGYLNRMSHGEKRTKSILRLISDYVHVQRAAIFFIEQQSSHFFSIDAESDTFIEEPCFFQPAPSETKFDSDDFFLRHIRLQVLAGCKKKSMGFTQGGSFFVGNLRQFVSSLTMGSDLCEAGTKGFESVAIMPLRSRSRIVGFLELCDKNPFKFNADTVRFFEGIAVSIGIAVARSLAERRVVQLNEDLEKRVQEKTRKLTLAHQKLLQDMEDRRLLEEEILNISEREQKRIGQELHDTIGQQLTGIAFMTKVLERKLAERGDEESIAAAEIGEVVKEALDKTRRISRGLQPVDIPRVSFSESLNNLAIDVRKMFDINCSIECEYDNLIKDAKVATNLYRITQEFITNAHKHGKAKNISVRLLCKERKSMLSITSDGVKFCSDYCDDPGIGLRLMKYRMESINGYMDIRAGEKEGTICTCIFPTDINSLNKVEQND